MVTAEETEPLEVDVGEAILPVEHSTESKIKGLKISLHILDDKPIENIEAIKALRRYL